MASPLPRPAAAGERVGASSDFGDAYEILLRALPHGSDTDAFAGGSTSNFAFPLPVSMPQPSRLPAAYPLHRDAYNAFVRTALPATLPCHNPTAAVPFGSCAPQPIHVMRVTPAPNRHVVGVSQRVTSTRRHHRLQVCVPAL